MGSRCIHEESFTKPQNFTISILFTKMASTMPLILLYHTGSYYLLLQDQSYAHIIVIMVINLVHLRE